MSCSNLPEVRNVGNGSHGESLMDETIVDEHVGHSKHSNTKPLGMPTGMGPKSKAKQILRYTILENDKGTVLNK